MLKQRDLRPLIGLKHTHLGYSPATPTLPAQPSKLYGNLMQLKGINLRVGGQYSPARATTCTWHQKLRLVLGSQLRDFSVILPLPAKTQKLQSAVQMESQSATANLDDRRRLASSASTLVSASRQSPSTFSTPPGSRPPSSTQGEQTACNWDTDAY